MTSKLFTVSLLTLDKWNETCDNITRSIINRQMTSEKKIEIAVNIILWIVVIAFFGMLIYDSYDLNKQIKQMKEKSYDIITPLTFPPYSEDNRCIELGEWDCCALFPHRQECNDSVQ